MILIVDINNQALAQSSLEGHKGRDKKVWNAVMAEAQVQRKDVQFLKVGDDDKDCSISKAQAQALAQASNMDYNTCQAQAKVLDRAEALRKDRDISLARALVEACDKDSNISEVRAQAWAQAYNKVCSISLAQAKAQAQVYGERKGHDT